MRVTLALLTVLAAAVSAGAAFAQDSDPGALLYPNFSVREPSTAAGPQPVFAVIGHHLVSGELKPSAPLMTLVDTRQPTFSCAPSQRGPEIVLSCSGGVSAQLKLDPSGCGRSRSGELASLCVGLSPKYAAHRLTAPAGHTLEVEDGRLALKPDAG
jgi:hypothetical protein